MLEALLLSGAPANSGGTVTFRHFRLYILARNDPAAITVGEWELYNEAGVNVAAGKYATASDQGFGNASAAFDGIVPVNLSQPRWQTNDPRNPQWLAVDLGAPMGVSSTALFCDTSQIPNYAIYSPNYWIFQGSMDGNNWEDIMYVSGQTTAVWSSKRKHEWVF